MSTSLIVSNSINIKATPENVWDALVNPEQTKKYMFGCAADSDWEVGSLLEWKGIYEGKEMVFVTGKIVAIEPGSYLAYTTFDPNNPAIEDKPENYLTVTYKVEAEQEGTKLTATQGDYSKVGDGEKRYKDTMAGGGWQSVLEQIKNILEN